ncbi:antibiotic biosynthesis monooxygenase [Streptomyces cocklensis]|jgi:heme-degrading monooxygenase HmoA|uniref:Heme-degrading monooxygenase HmoA n=1 Tax=Actinacidiphila cocklensis TaxID=887465 RepID=A0A9W4DSV6_9ACTN|nr:antibiotic biosynthesis monooxygenase family protein [Actinacidiphila cocklensis]MDD1059824.1 antibiotic biosynthesis monooxygenase [Actinacidiphila cocklensis]WSX72693.1 antibiotic biosynthesis monooxygenase [Streptomyces sp. NBC_00899]WSX81239.1 antibiotic biosynthesis monooxygenase [Streptomyces sp. NBC_00899]CAG6397107.1 Heme-degrading monooxygenase HmoA [Actinacidiphila cocklensis]
MVLEIAAMEIRAGAEDEFTAAYAEVRRSVLTHPGVHEIRLVRGVESTSRFMLLVEWEDVSTHEKFRQSEQFQTWRWTLAPYLAAPSQGEHYRDV